MSRAVGDSVLCSRFDLKVDLEAARFVVHVVERLSRHVECETDSAMFVGIVAPHQGVHVGSAETQKSRARSELLTPCVNLLPLAPTIKSRPEKFERIIQILKKRNLEPAVP